MRWARPGVTVQSVDPPLEPEGAPPHPSVLEEGPRLTEGIGEGDLGRGKVRARTPS